MRRPAQPEGLRRPAKALRASVPFHSTSLTFRLWVTRIKPSKNLQEVCERLGQPAKVFAACGGNVDAHAKVHRMMRRPLQHAASGPTIVTRENRRIRRWQKLKAVGEYNSCWCASRKISQAWIIGTTPTFSCFRFSHA